MLLVPVAYALPACWGAAGQRAAVATICLLLALSRSNSQHSLSSVFCPQIEQALVAGGYLKPNFHQFYWTSLKRINSVWQWSDYMFRGAFGNKTYQNWGTYKPGGFKEPYTSTGVAEDCGGSNFTQTVNQAWGWASAACGSSYVSVCRMQRK